MSKGGCSPPSTNSPWGESAGTQTFNLSEPRSVEVAVRTLDDILEEVQPPQIDLLVVDTETAESLIFEKFNLERYLSSLIVIETAPVEMRERILKAGYPLLYRGSSDKYFARPDRVTHDMG